jgi:hypothetical protein
VNYQWNSAVYTSGGVRYVATYVAPPGANAAAPVTTPNIGYTVGEIYQQLQNIRPPPVSFGIVQTAGALTTRAVTAAGVPITLPVPSVGPWVVPVGAVAIVTAP